jgi:hypothetical protein
LPDFTKDNLIKWGKEVKPFLGLPDMFSQLDEFVKQKQRFQEAGVELHFYIISSGLETVIGSTVLATYMKGVFACNFNYDSEGRPFAVRLAVTFTEKTKFLYAINKDISETELRREPYLVNDVVPGEDRDIPFPNMIYIGDGPSDIPCFSLVKQNHGTVIGVADKPSRGYELARGERLTMGPYSPVYTPGSDMRKFLETAIERTGDSIVLARQQRRRDGPTH